jgi:hypothetical protein
MKKIMLTILLSLIIPIFGNNGDKNKVKSPDANENTVMQKANLRPIVIANYYGSLYINGWQGSTLVVTCYDSPDLCVQIVRHDDGSLWAYLYLDRVLSYPISGWEEQDNQIQLNVIE